ncbi:unnamed protein product [Clonostachys rhizophaga]|uniref:Uncharacterized protein n=1 Tax=Clonostachys rhizophaga TaxID=160324 RepID=A0A9N9VUY1_9HYPO|nr:unnamed protein product [Clonostachys rhizophaga]
MGVTSHTGTGRPQDIGAEKHLGSNSLANVVDVFQECYVLPEKVNLRSRIHGPQLNRQSARPRSFRPTI